eukprot:TRINITY_DN11281_c0_g1_i1.p1 TRINITY_DN11281_c0_g1~~TRINITY_DN11281_c0_g1_i1.p1  ORF type:complete len:119 (-),score=28.12 TRINITY_DN11281_c0_g1_i1:90-446(-)
MLSHHLLLLVLPLALAGSLPRIDDPCYRANTNCFRKGENELGMIPYMKDIWACELACRDTDTCAWFTWYKQDGFHMCYLLTACAHPANDENGVSAKLEECTPDTTPTIRPTWTPPYQK